MRRKATTHVKKDESVSITIDSPNDKDYGLGRKTPSFAFGEIVQKVLKRTLISLSTRHPVCRGIAYRSTVIVQCLHAVSILCVSALTVKKFMEERLANTDIGIDEDQGVTIQGRYDIATPSPDGKRIEASIWRQLSRSTGVPACYFILR